MCVVKLLLTTTSTKKCKTKAGLGTEFYLFDIDGLASYTRNSTTKVIETLVMETGFLLQKVKGVVDAQEAKTDVTGNSNFPDYKTSFLMGLLYRSQWEKDDIEAICNAERVGVIYPTNEGQWKIAGIRKDPVEAENSPGLTLETGSFPEGKTTQDSTMATVLLSGTNTNGTVEFLPASGTFATAKAYLEALLVAP